jgi:hypothetical protein
VGVSHSLVTEINEAFVSGMHRGVLFAAVATFIGAIVVFRYLPARGTDPEPQAAAPATDPDEELIASGAGQHAD